MNTSVSFLKNSQRLGHIFSVGMIALALSACAPSTPTGTSEPAPPTASLEPPDNPKIELNAEIPGGPGPFVLDDRRVGLDTLDGYQSAMVVSFDGKRGGQPEKWSNTYTMQARRTPIEVRQMTVAYTADPPDETIRPPLAQTEIDGIVYSGDDTVGCTAKLVGPDAPSLAETEPATLMQVIVGAEEAGEETVNQVAARHYTFDEKALPLSSGQPFSGEIWVAAEGEYVVRYVLTTTGGPDFFGEGVEGTMTWQYDLTVATQSTEIVRPASCPPGELDAPTMPGATDMIEMVGLLTYHLPGTTIEDVLAFYKDEMTSRGWTAKGDPVIDTGKFGADTFTKDDLAVAVSVSIVDGMTSVTVSLRSAVPINIGQ